ncbi:MAG: hypothetical protein EZS28_047611, partial [Streblomastix strix]
MAAVIMSLRSFTLEIQTNETQCLNQLTDNTTVMYSLKKWKARKPLLHLVRIIAQICEEIKISLIVSHIPGLSNTQADSLSRLTWSRDYMLDPVTLQETLNTLKFLPTLDCFANRTNKQLKRYCSVSSDDNAIKVNAYTMNWGQEPVLIHPPINQIPKDQVSIIDNKCVEGIELGPIASSTYPKQENAEQRFREVTHRKHPGTTNDKSVNGEILYVNLLHLAGLTDDAIFQTLSTVSFETWRKRRTGLTYLADYIEINHIDIELLLGESPDIQ